METYFGHRTFSSDNPVVTLGIFDGVHRGHRSLLDSLVKTASVSAAESVVMTLDPHPRIVLPGNGNSLRLLTDLDEKSRLIEAAGVDKLVIIPFTTELSRLPACDFIKKYLVDVIGVRHLIMGFDHHFGYQGYEDRLTVSDCAVRYGFSVERMPALKEGDKIISSTYIRQLLSEGSLALANKMLGHTYSLTGKIVEGKKIGRLMGYPTANVEPSSSYKLIPADGVYAVEAILESGSHDAMLYIGPRPTLEKVKGKSSIEVHILDFNRDIYGKDITVKFLHRLRGDRKFSSREGLLEQIEKDKVEAIRLLRP